DEGRRHRRAAHSHHLVIAVARRSAFELRIISNESIGSTFSRDEFVTWGNEIRFDDVVVVLDAENGAIAARWATRAVSRDAVVSTHIAAERVRRANSDHGRIVSGSVNASVDLASGGVSAVITSRSDNNKSSVHQTPRSQAQWIVFVRIHC